MKRLLLLSVLSLFCAAQASFATLDLHQEMRESVCPGVSPDSVITSGILAKPYVEKAGAYLYNIGSSAVQAGADSVDWLASCARLIKPGHVAVGTVATTIGAATYATYKTYPAVTLLPATIIAGGLVQSAWRGKVYAQDARYMKDQAITHNRESFPLVFINNFGLCCNPHSPSTPEEIMAHYGSTDIPAAQRAERVARLWSELGTKTGMTFVDNYGDAMAHLKSTLSFIERQLDTLQKYTDIELALIPKVLEKLGKEGALVEPTYLRTTDALADEGVFEALDGWCDELQEQTWSDKFFKIRYLKTKILGLACEYPYYSSLSYNGASRYAVELLKQLARLRTLQLIVGQYLPHQDTKHIVHTNH